MTIDADGKYDWLHFTMRAGDPGHAWAKTYRSHYQQMDTSAEILRLTRCRKYDEAAQRADAFCRDLANSSFPDPSMKYVLERFYYGAVAYLHFCVGDLFAAQQALQQADDAVARAVDHAPVVLMLAVHCHEFKFHLARISRERREWPLMRHQVALAEQMLSGFIPLCFISGKAVWMANIFSFLSQLEGMSPEEQRALHALLDPAERTLACERMTRHIERVPYMAAYYA